MSILTIFKSKFELEEKIEELKEDKSKFKTTLKGKDNTIVELKEREKDEERYYKGLLCDEKEGRRLSDAQYENYKEELKEDTKVTLSSEKRILGEKLDKKIEENKEELFEAQAMVKGAEALISLYSEDNVVLQQQVTDYRSIIADLTQLLPKVDLSKFNINVDVPAKDVTINTK